MVREKRDTKGVLDIAFHENCRPNLRIGLVSPFSDVVLEFPLRTKFNPCFDISNPVSRREFLD